ncbi:MAG: hypothetical protein GY809_25660, partial [Planctomycetes bacterium]|nr:hypothetical protein [Planctomycetota bacterium]
MVNMEEDANEFDDPAAFHDSQTEMDDEVDQDDLPPKRRSRPNTNQAAQVQAETEPLDVNSQLREANDRLMARFQALVSAQAVKNAEIPSDSECSSNDDEGATGNRSNVRRSRLQQAIQVLPTLDERIAPETLPLKKQYGLADSPSKGSLTQVTPYHSRVTAEGYEKVLNEKCKTPGSYPNPYVPQKGLYEYSPDCPETGYT